MARSGANRAGTNGANRGERSGLGRPGVGPGGWRRPLLPGAGPLSRVHPAIAFIAVLGVFAVGVWWGGPGGASLLGLLAVAVGGLLAAAWPRLSTPDRAVRLLVVAVLVAIALQRWV